MVAVAQRNQRMVMRRFGSLLLMLGMMGPVHAQSIIKCGKAYSVAKAEPTRTRLAACINACKEVSARSGNLKWCRNAEAKRVVKVRRRQAEKARAERARAEKARAEKARAEKAEKARADRARAEIARLARARLEESARSAKSLVTFTSKPPGAMVWLDDARMGRTPLTLELVRGDYSLEMRLAGHETYAATLKVDGQKTFSRNMLRLPNAPKIGRRVVGRVSEEPRAFGFGLLASDCCSPSAESGRIGHRVQDRPQ
jgi:hypothetical protein